MNDIALPHSRRSLLSHLLRPIVVIPCVLAALLVASPFLIRQYYLSQIPFVELPRSSRTDDAPSSTDEPDGVEELLRALTLIPLALDHAEVTDDADGLPAITPALSRLLGDQQETYTLLQQAAAHPWSRSRSIHKLRSERLRNGDDDAIDKLDVVLAYRMKRQLLNADAPGSIESFLLLLQLARKLQTGSTRVEYEVGETLISRAHALIDGLCGHPTMTAADLQQLQAALEHHVQLPAPSFVDSLLADYAEIQDRTPESPPSLTGLGALTDWLDEFVGKRGRDWLFADTELHNRLSRQYIANISVAADRPIADQPPFFRAVNTDLPYQLDASCRSKGMLSAPALRALTTSRESLQEVQDHYTMFLNAEFYRRITLSLFPAAVALHRFKREHGHFPVKLQELVPRFLPEIPVDPTDRLRGPLLYACVDGKYILLSGWGNSVNNCRLESVDLIGSLANTARGERLSPADTSTPTPPPTQSPGTGGESQPR